MLPNIIFCNSQYQLNRSLYLVKRLKCFTKNFYKEYFTLVLVNIKTVHLLEYLRVDKF